MCKSLVVLAAQAMFLASLSEASGESTSMPAASLPEADTDIHLDDVMLQSGGGLLATPTLSPLENRIADIQKALQPTWDSIPKNEFGNLAHPAVRYALHRFFLWRHGWYMKNIGPLGDAWNDSTPSDMFGESEMSVQAQRYYEKRMGSRGLDQREIAILVVMLEDLVRGQAVTGLRHAYRLYHLPVEGNVSIDAGKVERAIEAYLVYHILSEDITRSDRASMKRFLDAMTEVYPSWPRLRSHVQAFRVNVTSDARQLDFARASNILVQFGDIHPDFHDRDHCVKLKDHLMTLEDPGTGRVPLESFYGDMTSKGMWQFGESPEYLKQLGALDNESIPGKPHVVIPNYLTGLSNCAAASKYHWLCCRTECESLLRRLEEEVQSTAATVEQIIGVVQSFHPTSGMVNRSLRESLFWRLGMIAHNHGGHVPLHGRLFAQWLHHAYPHECPYPHVSGSTNPLAPQDFEDETRLSALMSEDEAIQFVGNQSAPKYYKGSKDAPREELLPWNDVEELVVPHHFHAKTHDELAADKEVWAAASAMVFITAIATMALGLLRTAKKVSIALSRITSQAPKVDPYDV